MAMNPYAKYQEQSVMTMTHGEMLVKLYDEAIRQIRLAEAAIAQQDVPACNNALVKAQDIFAYLRSTLDHKYEISRQLEQFYNFFIEKLRDANIKKTAKDLPDLALLTAELRDAFAQSEKLARIEHQSGMPSSTVRLG